MNAFQVAALYMDMLFGRPHETRPKEKDMRKVKIIGDDEMVITTGIYESLVQDSQLAFLAMEEMCPEEIDHLFERWENEYGA